MNINTELKAAMGREAGYYLTIENMWASVTIALDEDGRYYLSGAEARAESADSTSHETITHAFRAALALLALYEGSQAA